MDASQGSIDGTHEASLDPTGPSPERKRNQRKQGQPTRVEVEVCVCLLLMTAVAALLHQGRIFMINY